MAELEVYDLTLQFGGVKAIDGLTFTLTCDRVHAIVGPNGAGKTSLFNCITGLYTPTKGRIRFDGHDITRLRADKIAALGVTRTFQNLAYLRDATVMENVLLAELVGRRTSVTTEALGIHGHAWRSRVKARERATDLLAQFNLAEYASLPMSELAFGAQKLVELVRALLPGPRLILVDEPAGGLNAEEVRALSETLRRLPDEHDVGVVLVEHNMGLVTAIAEEVIVLDGGKLIARGGAKEVVSDPIVVEAYLGGVA